MYFFWGGGVVTDCKSALVQLVAMEMEGWVGGGLGGVQEDRQGQITTLIIP